MGNVALVPERIVLEGGSRVAPEQTCQADDLLAPDRVALVGHRGRALLTLGEWLFDLADLRLLQAADLEREFLERRAGDCDGREELGMAVALDHLRSHRRGLEVETPADLGFDGGRPVPEGGHGAR